MSAAKKVVIGVVVLATVGVAWILVRPKAVLVEVGEVRRGEFVQTVRAEAKVLSQRVLNVTSSFDGDLGEVKFRVGDLISKGDVVAEVSWDSRKRILAPLSGVVTEIFRESPGPVVRGAPLLAIADLERLEVVAEVLTSDAVNISVGQTVRLTGWGGEETIASKVSKVSRAGFTKASALGVDQERTQVFADLGHLDSRIRSRLGHSYHVLVDIETANRPGQVLVPVGALFKMGERWAVYRWTQAARAEIALVDLGARNASVGVVIDGLKSGDRVVLYPSDLVRPGVPLKLHP